MRRKRLWFVEPLDAHTNEVFARELDDQLSPQVRKVRIGRESIKVWEVSPDRRDFFVRSKDTASLHFHVYTSLEGDKIIRKMVVVISKNIRKLNSGILDNPRALRTYAKALYHRADELSKKGKK